MPQLTQQQLLDLTKGPEAQTFRQILTDTRRELVQALAANGHDEGTITGITTFLLGEEMLASGTGPLAKHGGLAQIEMCTRLASAFKAQAELEIHQIIGKMVDGEIEP